MTRVPSYEPDGYMNRKEKAMIANCIAEIESNHSINSSNSCEVWFYALGYINGCKRERWHSIHPGGFADTVTNYFKGQK